MTPLYFGTNQELFGIFHSPDLEQGKNAGVVLCYPFGQDYVYAFRAFRVLANRLARNGFSVLRFDYIGTGDSADDVESISVLQWTANVLHAIQQVRSTASASITLVGYQLGASLAAIAAGRSGEISSLVLWDPVVNGTEYVSRLMRRHRIWCQELIRQVPDSRKLETPEDLLGFRLTEKLRADLERVDLLSLRERPASDVLILSTDKPDTYFALSNKLRELGSNVHVKQVEDQKLSSTIPGLQIGLVPNHILAEIEGWLRAHENA